MKTLAIETSCDDTSLAIVKYENGIFEVEKLLAYSQISDHQKYGGVVPEIASRLHSEKIIAILQEIGRENIQKADFISVTTHPGLPGSLVVGKTAAYTLGDFFQKPVQEVNHIFGHIFSIILERPLEEIKFPLVILTASGGHNDIYFVTKEHTGAENTLTCGEFFISKKGQTLDDAAGECFDKVSRMLGGPYPGGARIGQKASQGSPNADYQFKRIFLSKESFEFSFSGMKSQVSFLLNKLEKEGKMLTEEDICDIAYEFQEAVVEVLGKKLIKAGILFQAKTIALAGGVSANNRLCEYISSLVEKHNQKSHESLALLTPTKKVYSTDNGAMIGVVGILDKNFLP